MTHSICWFALGLLFQGIYCAQWSHDSLQDGAVVYACAGGETSFPWKYVISAGETLTDIQWFLNGQSSELIAIYSHGAFLPLPAFSKRVTYLPDGGIVMRHLTKSDAGNVSVEISGHRDDGSFFSLRRSVSVQVADGLSTSDGELHVKPNVNAVFDPNTKRLAVELLCGHFTYSHQAPFNADWKTPSGVVQPSAEYRDGYFRLHVTQPLTGAYTCVVPPLPACLHGNGSQGAEATLTMNGLEARLSLLEAGQAALQSENVALKQEVTSLRGDNDNLKAAIGAANCGAGGGDGLNYTVALVQQRMEQLELKSNQPRVYFHAEGLDVPRLNASVMGPIVVGPSVVLNHGHAYDPTTGYFTAPVAGVYFFIGTVGAEKNNYYSGFQLNVWNGGHPKERLGHMTLRGEQAAGTVSGAVHLEKGDQVFIQSATVTGANVTLYNDNVAMFTGFLLAADTN